MSLKQIIAIISVFVVGFLIYQSFVDLSPRDLSICGLAINMVASLILAMPLLKSLQEMAKECTSLDGFNVYLMRSMKRDKKVTLLGLFVLALGFLFQLGALL